MKKLNLCVLLAVTLSQYSLADTASPQSFVKSDFKCRLGVSSVMPPSFGIFLKRSGASAGASYKSDALGEILECWGLDEGSIAA